MAAPAAEPLSDAGPPSAFTAFRNRLVESYQTALSRQRPWSELTDRSSFSKPENLNDALSRIRKNFGFYSFNYLAIILMVVVVSMLFKPMSIIWLALLGCIWVYMFAIRTDPLVIGGRTLGDREKFLGMIVVSIVVVFGLTSVGSILMSGVVIGAVAITIHAALRVPDDLFLDEAETGGFLSFLGPVGQRTTTLGV